MQREKERVVLSEYSTTEINTYSAADQTKFHVQSKIHANQVRVIALYSDLSYNIQNQSLKKKNLPHIIIKRYSQSFSYHNLIK